MLELADDASGQKTGDMEALLVLRHSCGTSCARGGGATSSSDSLKYPRLALKEQFSFGSKPRWLARIFSELRSSCEQSPALRLMRNCFAEIELRNPAQRLTARESKNGQLTRTWTGGAS